MILQTNVVDEKRLRKAQVRALNLFADCVKPTYGPMGGYTIYSKADPNDTKKAIVAYYTKDGFKTLNSFMASQPIEEIIKADIVDICRNVVKKIGDGTTSATILSSEMFKRLVSMVDKSDYNKREIITAFKDLLKELSDNIKAQSRECTIDDIYNIAYTSLNGNAEHASIIQEIYRTKGMNVFIDVQSSNNDETVIKSYSGLTYNTGYADPAFINDITNKRCLLNNPKVYVFESPIDTPDMQQKFAWILEKELFAPVREYQEQMKGYKNVKSMNPESDISKPTTPHLNNVVIVCPMISRDANGIMDQLTSNLSNLDYTNRYGVCVISGLQDPQYLIDIQKLTGAKFIKKYIDPKTMKDDEKNGLSPTINTITDFAGDVEQFTSNSLSTSFINPKNMYNEDGSYTTFFKEYISELEETLKMYQETRQEIVKIGKLKRRINLLKSTMVDLYVGGIAVADRLSLSDSIEDAVLNCRSAATDGVCYGANFTGYKCSNELEIKYTKLYEEVQNDDSKEYKARLYKDVSQIIFQSYCELTALIYLPYVSKGSDDKISNTMRALKLCATGLTMYHKPFNIITEEYDDLVLTSAKTEPTILDSISRIISLLFDTNQFLLPSPMYNPYVEDDTIIIDDNKSLKQTKEDFKTESIPLND